MKIPDYGILVVQTTNRKGHAFKRMNHWNSREQYLLQGDKICGDTTGGQQLS